MALNSELRILIVDDNQENLKLLGSLLSKEGYRLNVALEGKQALDMVNKSKPDLILLDIVMPIMDGFATCKILKSDPEYKDIPIIFLTSSLETESIVKGFDLGAIDYLTKPFNSSELLARVKTHIELKKSKEIIKKQYKDLLKVESLRNSLASILVHDLKNPLTSISGYAQLILRNKDDSKLKKYLNRIVETSDVMLNLIMSILDVSKMESNKMNVIRSKINIKKIFEDIESGLYSTYENKNIKLEIEFSVDSSEIVADSELFKRILINLISNAIKYSPQNGIVKLQITKEGAKTKFFVMDQGKGIPEEFKDKIFEKFGQIEIEKKGERYSTGLGLTFCKMAVEAHGGEIGFYKNNDGGNTFWFNI